MAKKYKHLLSPIQIGNVVLKNRMVFPNASPHFLQGPETFPAEGYRAFNTGLARNGAAIVTLAEWGDPNQRKGPDTEDFTHMQSFDLNDPSTQNYLSAMADEIHFYGSKLLVCMKTEFPSGYTLNGDKSRGGPGDPQSDEPPKLLTEEMINEVIDKIVAKLKKYKNMGYDGFGDRIEQYLLPAKNPRNDKFGGSVENRTRFLIMLCTKIKKELGKDFLIELQVAAEQPFGNFGDAKLGYTLEDTIEFARLAEGVVDILQLREKDAAKSHPTGFTFNKGEHESVRYSMAIKAAGIKILTEPIGGFQDPDEIEGYLADGKCDMIGLARAFMADPEYGLKLEQGRAEDITPCLWCNKCHGTVLSEPDPWISVCSVNPLLGIEDRLHRLVRESGERKNVAVIGGGPAGMRSAIYAAERGHRVTLFEKSGYLGGQLRHAEYYSFKWPIRDFRNWLVRSMEKAGVEVIMNTEPSPEMITEAGFDAVIAATGAKANVPAGIDGISKPNGTLKDGYYTCHDVFGREKELGKHVIIIGASETGVETAMYLCENGHDVTMLTRQDRIGHDCSRLHYITSAFVKVDPKTGHGRIVAAWEKYDNLIGIPNAATTRVDGGKVTYVDSKGNESTIAGDSIVICGGVSPRVSEAMKYSAAADKFLIVGDCNRMGNIQRCMRDAYAKANMI